MGFNGVAQNWIRIVLIKLLGLGMLDHHNVIQYNWTNYNENIQLNIRSLIDMIVFTSPSPISNEGFHYVFDYFSCQEFSSIQISYHLVSSNYKHIT